QRGLQGLEELGRAPHRHPNQTAEELRALIVQTKLRRQKWGPKKVLDWLRHQRPELKWPADSTAGEILKRAGLVQPRKRRRRVAPYSEPFGECGAPNQSWSADFKGDFLLKNGRRCYPLTISDNFSRYLLLCRALERPRQEEVKPWFEWVFRVRHKGEIKWRGKVLYLSEVLAKEPVGLKPIDEHRWELRYSFHLLGILDERNKNISPATGWHGAK